jgi:hypothetical protein
MLGYARELTVRDLGHRAEIYGNGVSPTSSAGSPTRCSRAPRRGRPGPSEAVYAIVCLDAMEGPRRRHVSNHAGCLAIGVNLEASANAGHLV